MLSPTKPKRRRWLFLLASGWLMVAAIILGMHLFMLSTTYIYTVSDGCHSELELMWGASWIQPLQPFFSMALVAGSFIFALRDAKRHEIHCTEQLLTNAIDSRR